jgi:hypothetical protein
MTIWVQYIFEVYNLTKLYAKVSCRWKLTLLSFTKTSQLKLLGK